MLNLPPALMPPPPTILLPVRTVLVSVLCRHGGVTCDYQCSASGGCRSALCVRCFLADCLCVCFSLLPLRPLSVPRPSLVLPVSARPSSISGQPTSAPATPTAAACAALFPTSLTVHSFVSLHQYCCPSADQGSQQEDR